MIEIRHTSNFKQWLRDQRGKRARGLVQAHVDRLQLELPSDVQEVQPGLFELRIEQGLGYRLYFTCLGPAVIVMLWAGDNRTRERDLMFAHKLFINL